MTEDHGVGGSTPPIPILENIYKIKITKSIMVKKGVVKERETATYFIGILGVILLSMGVTQILFFLITNNFKMDNLEVLATTLFNLIQGAGFLIFGLILGIVGKSFNKKNQNKECKTKIKKIISLVIWGNAIAIIISTILIVKVFILANATGGLY